MVNVCLIPPAYQSAECRCVTAFTLNSAYNEKKYVEILPRYRWLFVKGDVFIGEMGIFDAEVFLHYNQFFIKGDFIIGRVECTFLLPH